MIFGIVNLRGGHADWHTRVSDDQNLISNALKMSVVKNFTTLMTGNKYRPGLEAAIDFCQQGNIIVVWRLDKLSRSLKDLIEMSCHT